MLLRTWLACGYLLMEAVERARPVDGILWSQILLLLVVGHAMMLWGVLAASFLWAVGHVVTDSVW